MSWRLGFDLWNEREPIVTCATARTHSQIDASLHFIDRVDMKRRRSAQDNFALLVGIEPLFESNFNRPVVGPPVGNRTRIFSNIR